MEEQTRLVRVAEQQRQIEERQKLQQQLFQVSLGPRLQTECPVWRRQMCLQTACLHIYRGTDLCRHEGELAWSKDSSSVEYSNRAFSRPNKVSK